MDAANNMSGSAATSLEVSCRLEAVQGIDTFQRLHDASEPLRELAERTRACHRELAIALHTLEQRTEDRDWNAYRGEALARLGKCYEGCDATTLARCGVPRDVIRDVVDYFRRCRLALEDGIDPAPQRTEADRLYSDLIVEADARTATPSVRPAEAGNAQPAASDLAPIPAAVLPRRLRPPLTENDKRVARIILKQPEGKGVPNKDLERESEVKGGALDRSLESLRAWGVGQYGKRGAGYSLDSSDNKAALARACE